MNDLGLCEEFVMPPLYPLNDEERNKILKHFRHNLEKENLLIKTGTNV